MLADGQERLSGREIPTVEELPVRQGLLRLGFGMDVEVRQKGDDVLVLGVASELRFDRRLRKILERAERNLLRWNLGPVRRDREFGPRVVERGTCENGYRQTQKVDLQIPVGIA